jgi:hypothetical protein
VKKTARLVLFFSVCFTVSFLVLAGIGLLRVWIAAAAAIPMRPVTSVFEIAGAIRWAFPFSLHFTILLSASYAAREKLPLQAAIVAMLVVASLFSYAAATGLRNARAMNAPPVIIDRPTLGNTGLKLENAGVPIVLLDDPAHELASRVVLLEDSLVYETMPMGPEKLVPRLPSAPFREAGASFFETLILDFSISAEQIELRFAQGIVPFAAYTFSLILLLVSLSFVLDMGAWPLANVFLGALVFRMILAFEVFLATGGTEEYITQFLGRWIPPLFVIPAILGSLGVLLLFYTVLVFFAQER